MNDINRLNVLDFCCYGARHGSGFGYIMALTLIERFLGADMAIILQVDFPFEDPWGQDMTAGMKALAESIAKEPGLLWKIWTENPAAKEAGGIYFFIAY